MSANSGIEWTDASWNVVIGCSKISEGCKNCYAETFAARLAAMGQDDYGRVIDFDTHQWTGKTYYRSSHLFEPLKWKKGKLVFVSSMGDLFHDSVTNLERDNIMAVMWECRDRHTFILCTKRPENMQKYFLNYKPLAGHDDWPWAHVWLMTTVENQKVSQKRIQALVDTPALVHGLSVEPMLTPVDIMPWITEIEWVICGCESGANRRLTDVSWIRHLRDQCKEGMIPFFLKQMEVDGRVVKMPELDKQVHGRYPGWAAVEAFNHF